MTEVSTKGVLEWVCVGGGGVGVDDSLVLLEPMETIDSLPTLVLIGIEDSIRELLIAGAGLWLVCIGTGRLPICIELVSEAADAGGGGGLVP